MTDTTRMTEGAVDHEPGVDDDAVTLTVEDLDAVTGEPADAPEEVGRPPAETDSPVEDEDEDRG